MSLSPEPQKTDRPTAWLVPIVLAIGALLGVGLSYVVPVPSAPRGPFGFVDQLKDLRVLHMVLSTVSIALLVALIVVYFRMYKATGARFALGILVVMFALLIQALFSYPLFLGVGRFDIGFGPYFSTADIFTIAAYTIFLYLSLE
jgi:hypothetical protein